MTGSSAIKRCSNGDKDCVETLTINLDISAGENGLEEILVKQAADAGASKSLAKAIKLSFYMEKPVLKYDLTYFTDFNAEPFEQLMYGATVKKSTGTYSCTGSSGTTKDTSLCFGVGLFAKYDCNDGGNDPHASCGWLYPMSYVASLQKQGKIKSLDPKELLALDWSERRTNVVLDSQGFCCDCKIIGDLLLGDGTKISRGKLACNALDSDSPSASAHCLRMGKLWYSAYEIGQAREHFNVYARLSTCDESGTTCQPLANSTIVAVGPTSPKAVIKNNDNDVRIAWQYYGKADSPIGLTSKYLLRPNCHGSSACTATYGKLTQSSGMAKTDITDPTRWLLIDKTDVTKTGNECNKIGISYSGFRNQGMNKCVSNFGSCLGKKQWNGQLMSSSQVTDYVKSDLAVMKTGKRGKYFPQFLYPSSRLSAETNGKKDFASLEYALDDYRSSKITLVMKGELMKVVEYSGKLDEKNLEFGLTCVSDKGLPVPCVDPKTMEAQKTGILEVTLRNEGKFPDQYTISFPQNSAGSRTYMYKKDASGAKVAMAGKEIPAIQAKSTETLAGRNGATNICPFKYQLRESVKVQAKNCYSKFNAKESATKCASFIDDCDTTAFSVKIESGIQAAYCVTMLVKNNQGRPEAEKELCFNSTKTVYNKVGEAADPYDKSNEGLIADPNAFPCSTFCPSTLDVTCMLNHPVCEDKVMMYGTVLLAALLFTIVGRRIGLFKIIGCCMSTKTSKKKKRSGKKKGKKMKKQRREYSSSESDSDSGSDYSSDEENRK